MNLAIIFPFAIIAIGATWLAARRINKSRLTTNGGSKTEIKLPTFEGAGKKIPVAVAMIAAGILVLWIFWGVITAFPSMSLLEQVMVLAGVLFAVLAGYGVYAIYQKGDPVWPQRFAVVAIGGILLFGGLTYIYGADELTGSNQQGLFVGNKPNAMGRTNLDGEFIVVHGLTPGKCVPAGFDAFDADGNIFPFASTDKRGSNECYKNGIPLVPNSRATTPDVSGYTPQGIMGWLTTTPAEKAAEEAAEQAKIDAAHQRRVELQWQREKARLAALEPDVAPCNSHKLRSFKNCYRVTVKRNGPPFLMTKNNPANAIMRDDADGSRVEVSGFNFAYYHNSSSKSQVTFSVWEMMPGQTYRTANINYTHK